MKVLVSSCVMGCSCKYNGGNSLNSRVVDFLKDKEVIEICPEMLVGMSIPRASAEIVNGCVTEVNGKAGKLIEGQGLFAKALINAGYRVIDSEMDCHIHTQ
ncbi:DUF523 domain-containing protein [Clostridium thailandense]|uniref:DUF523 domain-containing protein n=1 Tax=Clostridium thailandense TaxID=2794346 RepID=UPI003989AE0E